MMMSNLKKKLLISLVIILTLVMDPEEIIEDSISIRDGNCFTNEQIICNKRKRKLEEHQSSNKKAKNYTNLRL